jgi:hypothetical protein
MGIKLKRHKRHIINAIKGIASVSGTWLRPWKILSVRAILSERL